MGRKHLWLTFETPRKRAAPQDDGLNLWLGNAYNNLLTASGAKPRLS
jgi:hypothetical protein